MKQYRNHVRVAILTRLNNLDYSLLDDNIEFDRSISALASRVLPRIQLQTFFFAYSCEDSWDDIVENYENCLEARTDEEAVRKNGNKAIDRLVREADDAPELEEWRTES